MMHFVIHSQVCGLPSSYTIHPLDLSTLCAAPRLGVRTAAVMNRTCFAPAGAAALRLHARSPAGLGPRRRARRLVSTATADPAAPSGVNVNQYSSQRAVLTTEREGLEPAEVNALFRRAGRAARDEAKWQSAIEYSFIIVSARLMTNKQLVGFARATSDRALNGTVWDVVTDPALPDELAMRRKVVVYLLKELRRTVPGCSIALFSREADRKFFENLDFVSDPDGIRGMAVFESTFEC